MVQMFSCIIGDGESSEIEIAHGLKTRHLIIQVYDEKTKEMIREAHKAVVDEDRIRISHDYITIANMDTNQFERTRGVIPKDGWRVVVMG